MPVDLIEDVATALTDGGDAMADETIWVDSTGQPWRLNSYTSRYERLTDSGWRVGTPVGALRKLHSIPGKVTATMKVVAQADSNTYLIKGEKGEKGDPGVQGIQGLKGDKGDPGDPGPIGTAVVYRQETPQSVTEITHNLDRDGPVHITIFSLDGEIEYFNFFTDLVSPNVARVTFDDPTAFVATVF